MTILKEAPECYIQQCSECGAVLKYSECDIHVANKYFPVKTAEGDDVDWIFMYDSFVCPVCSYINEAKRKWMIE